MIGKEEQWHEQKIEEYAEKVLLTAYDLLASGNKVQIWIAKDVIKELETVVKVKERKRLITSNSKMGRER